MLLAVAKKGHRYDAIASPERHRAGYPYFTRQPRQLNLDGPDDRHSQQRQFHGDPAPHIGDNPVPCHSHLAREFVDRRCDFSNRFFLFPDNRLQLFHRLGRE